MSSPQDSPPPLVVQRKRARTSVLLGSDYEELVTSEATQADAPPPLQSEDYDGSHARAGLLFADRALRYEHRKMSPIGVRALQKYKEACASLLELETITSPRDEDWTPVKEEYIAMMRGYEQSVQYILALSLKHSENAEGLQEKLTELLSLSWFATYEDYLDEISVQIRDGSNHYGVEGKETLSGKYWSQIAAELHKEASDWKKVGDGKLSSEVCPTTRAVWMTSRNIGIPSGEVISAIGLYGLRNKLLHTGLADLIKAGKFSTLAGTLHKDRCNILVLMPDNPEVDIGLMQTLLLNIKNRWFKPHQSRGNDNPEAWLPTPTLLEYRASLQDLNEQDAAKRIQDDVKKTCAATKRAMEKKREEEDTMENIRNKSMVTMGFPNPSKKRVASCDLEDETARAKKQLKSWKVIDRLSKNVRKLVEEFEEALLPGECFGPPSEIVEDKYLNEEAD